jgi:sulfoxide reductase catalytic subunit YedY
LPSARAVAAKTAIPNLTKGALSTAGEAITPKEDVTHYNNFYEFGAGKEQPAVLAQKFKTSPWIVSIEGEVEKPIKLSMDDMP